MQRISSLSIYRSREGGGYARKVAHLRHGPFRVIDKCVNHATRFEIVNTHFQVFPVMHVSKVKLIQMFPDLPMERRSVNEEGRVDFDKALLPGDSMVGDLAEDEYKVKKVMKVRSG